MAIGLAGFALTATYATGVALWAFRGFAAGMVVFGTYALWFPSELAAHWRIHGRREALAIGLGSVLAGGLLLLRSVTGPVPGT